MSYYLLLQDDRYVHAAEPAGLAQMIDRELLTRERVSELSGQLFPCVIKEQPSPEYIDYIERPFPLLSDRFKRLVEKIAPKVAFVAVVLTDPAHLRQEPYWLAVPPVLDCLSEQSEYHKNGTLRTIVIDERKAGKSGMFVIENVLERRIVLSLPVAESLLRRGFTGIRLQKVAKVGREGGAPYGA